MKGLFNPQKSQGPQIETTSLTFLDMVSWTYPAYPVTKKGHASALLSFESRAAGARIPWGPASIASSGIGWRTQTGPPVLQLTEPTAAEQFPVVPVLPLSTFKVGVPGLADD